MAFDSTCRIAVPWKNDEAPTVTPWTRVVIVMSPLGVRVPNYPRKVYSRVELEARGETYAHARSLATG
jgi:hypothetical protein